MGERPPVRGTQRRLRVAASAVLVAALLIAVWLQRGLIVDAVAQTRQLSIAAVTVLLVLGVYERWSRADIMRRLLNGSLARSGGRVAADAERPVSIRRATVVHDVGNAISKAIPLGGALGTAVRWTIVREVDVPAPRFASTIVAYGVATTFASWLLPFAALGIDLTHRPGGLLDWLLLTGIGIVLIGSAVFWMLVLRSDALERWGARRLRGAFSRLSTRVPACGDVDASAALCSVRSDLRALIRRPMPLLGLTVVSQACGSVILFTALRALGAGAELGVSEFFRVFFLVTLIGSFAPTPGGVGAIEAGMTGALVAAGVDAPIALAGVLIYRSLVYVTPIVVGASCYVVWRARSSQALDAEAPLASVGGA